MTEVWILLSNAMKAGQVACLNPYGSVKASQSLSCVSHSQMDCNLLLTAIFGCLVVTVRGELKN